LGFDPFDLFDTLPLERYLEKKEKANLGIYYCEEIVLVAYDGYEKISNYCPCILLILIY